MAKHTQRLKTFLEHALPWLVLVFLLFYTYAKFAQHPYSGIRLSADGHVIAIYSKNTEPPLAIGDQLIRIDALLWEDFTADLRKPLFKDVQPGQTVPITVVRDGEPITIPWVFPGLNPLEILDLVINESWLAYVFWLVGTLTFLHLRPKDERWALMMAFNYLTAIWIITGSGASFYHIWESAIILRMAIWFCVPVYLHFHWVYPRPFGKLPTSFLWSFYLGASVLALAEWFQLLPTRTYFLGFFLAVCGSLILFVAHVILQADARRDLRLLPISLLLALVPAMLVGFLGAFSSIPISSGAGTLGLPFLPLTYFYASYRRQLGASELRVNRWVSTITFLIMIGVVTTLLVTAGSLFVKSVGDALLFGAVIVVLIAFMSIWSFPVFQTFVERSLLGIPLPPRNLQEIYADRLATSNSISGLLKLLEDEVLPSLLVRQFAFLKLENDSPELLLSIEVTDEQILSGCDFNRLMAVSGKYRPDHMLRDGQPCPWAHLILPLKVGESVLGFWLFGRRDPDDLYAQSEISILQSLANQTAIALSNLLQTERLRALYQDDINRYEQERLRLARDLHDSILNQLAALMIHVDTDFSPKFQEAYDSLTEHLRQIVSDLRPPMLNYGLKPALTELADNLMERNDDYVNVTVEIEADHIRYDPKIELHLFRIIQEASGNALKHAHARNIKIAGSLVADKIELILEDDGAGFDAGAALNLDALLSRKHFGLAGMIERAAIIGAEVGIASKPEEGTRIQITWKQNHV